MRLVCSLIFSKEFAMKTLLLAVSLFAVSQITHAADVPLVVSCADLQGTLVLIQQNEGSNNYAAAIYQREEKNPTEPRLLVMIPDVKATYSKGGFHIDPVTKKPGIAQIVVYSGKGFMLLIDKGILKTDPGLGYNYHPGSLQSEVKNSPDLRCAIKEN